jgi:Fur family zinc uptake transcriptional regulator
MSSTQELDLERELADAETLALNMGERFTLPRRKVYRRLLEAGGPLKAYDLIGVVDSDSHRAKPPTVYRALDFLCRLGLVHRIESDQSYFACNHHKQCDASSHVPLVFVCLKCGKVQERHVTALEEIISKTAIKRGFKVEKMMLEAHGICALCDGKYE